MQTKTALFDKSPTPLRPHFTVLAEGLQFPEGPAFAPDGTLWAVELKGQSLIRWQAGQWQRYPVGGSPNGLTPGPDGMIWFCDAGQHAIRRYNPETGETETMVREVDGHPLDKPNDLVFDGRGNLIFTCPGDSRQSPDGYVCVRTASGEVRKISTGKYFPNGLTFNADFTELTLAETYRHRLWKGIWQMDSARLLSEHVWAAVEGPSGPGGPDGMALHPDGHLFVAVYGTGKIHVLSQAGQVVSQLELPGRNPTNCAFDPADPATLVITEAEKGQILACRLPFE